MRSYHATKQAISNICKSIQFNRKATLVRAAILLLAAGSFSDLYAQGENSGGSSTNNLILLLFGATLILIAFIVIVFSDKMIKISAEQAGEAASVEADNIGILPSRNEFRAKSEHKYAGQSTVHKLKKGFDIKIKGKPVKNNIRNLTSRTFAIKPIDYKGIQPIPKLTVAVGDEVKAGDPVFYDKANPDIQFTTPVSGEVVEINRGDKRAINEVVILADGNISYKSFERANPADLSREQVMDTMMKSGTWVSLIERPFGLIANPEHAPKNIFISLFDTSPLAPDYNFILKDRGADFHAGVRALQKLTEGDVHIGLNAKKKPLPFLHDIEGAKFHWFEGKHPAGNVGIQIHRIDPIRKGDIVWTINPMDVATVGKLFNEGIYSPDRLVTLGGPELDYTGYYKTLLGANVERMLVDNLQEENVRIISGNVLTGTEIDKKGHLGAFDHTVSVIEEGDFYEFMGWLLPSYARPSSSITFPWALFPFEEFEVNTNTHGEQRAFVMTGQYEEVLPMDLYPVHLLKAILTRDFDQMEGLGIYEVLEEDLALCEFVCTSKQPVQEILRDGLDYMKEQS